MSFLAARSTPTARVEYTQTGKGVETTKDRISEATGKSTAIRRRPPKSLAKKANKIWKYNMACLLLTSRLKRQQDSRRARAEWKQSLKKCRNTELPLTVQCNLASSIEYAGIQLDKERYDSIYFLERLRFQQRQETALAAQSGTGKTSVVLFMCQLDRGRLEECELQDNLEPYVWCAHALKYLTTPYRMIICNHFATQETMQRTAGKLGVDITGVHITYLRNIDSFDLMTRVVQTVTETEQISLVYISAHANEDSLFLGKWYGTGKEYEEITREDMGTLCALLQGKKAPDMQVFCNACLSNQTLAPFMASLMPSTIVIGADRSILTGQVLHAFKVDALHNRLYFSVNVINLDLCELYANVKDAQLKPLTKQGAVEAESGAGSSSSTAIMIDLFSKTKLIF